MQKREERAGKEIKKKKRKKKKKRNKGSDCSPGDWARGRFFYLQHNFIMAFKCVQRVNLRIIILLLLLLLLLLWMAV